MSEKNCDNASILMHLRVLANASRRHIDRHCESKKQLDNLSASGGWILSRVFEMEHMGEAAYQRDLEDDFGITRSTASKLLARLEQKGLIERRGIIQDGRMKRILPTDKSRKIGEDILLEVQGLEDRLERGFSKDELETLCKFFERLEKNLADADREMSERSGKQSKRRRKPLNQAVKEAEGVD